MMIGRFFAVAIVLAGCAGPYVRSSTPVSITLRYDAWIGDPQESANIAQAHCDATGRDARLNNQFATGTGAIMETYDCVAR